MNKMKLWHLFVLMVMNCVVIISMFVNTNDYTTNWILALSVWMVTFSTPLILYDILKYWNNVEALRLLFFKHDLNSITYATMNTLACIPGLIFMWFGDEPYMKTMAILFVVPSIINLSLLGVYIRKAKIEIYQ